MKLKFLILFFAFVLFFTPYEFAQDESTDSGEIEQFKEKLASKVAELQKKDERAMPGFITEIKGKQIKLKTKDNETYTVEVDDVLTKFYSLETGVKKEIEFKNLTKEDYIIIAGPISGKIITANNIYRDTSYSLSSGVVNEVNQSEYFLKALSFENEEITIDVESATKRLVVNAKNLGFETIGFSKIKSGDIVHSIFKKSADSKKDTRFSATKFIVIPQEYFSK